MKKKREIFTSDSELSDTSESDSDFDNIFKITKINIFSKIVRQRKNDGYICVNDVVNIYKKKTWSQYKNNKRTKKLINEVIQDTGLPRNQLITTNQRNR